MIQIVAPVPRPKGAAGHNMHRADSRLRYIDSLRAIAALLVVWLHVTQSYVKLDGEAVIGGHWLYDIAQNLDVGRVGIVAFFLISGFVIPFSIHPDRTAPVGSFLIKRVFRIYPAYWLSIPLGALATCWLWGQPFGMRDFLVNLTLLQDIVGAPAAQGVYWTLLVELGFYLLCVVLFLTRSLYNPVRIGLLAMFLAFVHSLSILLIWLGTPVMGLTPAFWCLHLSLMLCGTLYRLCMAESGTTDLANARKILCGLLIYYLVVFPVGAGWAHGFLRNYVVSDGLGLLFFIAGTSVARIETRITDWLGAISYSIYLFHLVVYYPIFWWLEQQPAGSWWRTQHLGVYLLVNAGLTIALAALVYRFVEKPCIRLGHRYADQWARRAARRRIGAETPAAASAAVPVAIAKPSD
jgi:peptidoglycan/LPS O-acetylase OafA/YrhL